MTVESGDCLYFALVVKQSLSQGPRDIHSQWIPRGPLDPARQRGGTEEEPGGGEEESGESSQGEPDQVVVDSSARNAFEIKDKETYNFGEIS